MIGKTESHCRRVLNDAGVQSPADELDAVVLVGGSTRIPAVRDLVARVFEKTPDVTQHPDEAIALGAVIQAGVLSGALREPLYAGIAALIDELDAEGRLLGVATGKSDRGLHACLDTHGIKHRFVSLQTADRHPSKPHPAMLEAALGDAGVAPADAVMIGDTSFDMDMARAAGVGFIGVAWGYHEVAQLADADVVIEDFAQLEGALETVWSKEIV